MTCAVLVVEDETVFAKNIQSYLAREGYEVRVASDANAAMAEFDSFRPAIVLLDYNLPGSNGLEILARMKAKDPQVAVVMLTGHGGVDIAVQAMKSGAVDYLSKPVALGELKLVINRVTQREKIEGTLAYYQKREAKSGGLDALIGASQPMIDLKAKVEQIIAAEHSLTDNDAPAVLITGETGAGKELVARALHFSGARAARPFVEINCASIPANLLEAELFGYERGAFTDAKERKPGLVEAADSGTLFLDEIGEIDVAVQVKLLKLLEEKRVRRLGGIREKQVNVRIVAATNRDLDAMVRDGTFRADLFYRLRILHVVVLPLRQRGDDILLLARHFLASQGARYGRGGLKLAPEAERVLRAYRWPGNVRELRNAIEQAVLLTTGSEITAVQFPFCETALESAAVAESAVEMPAGKLRDAPADKLADAPFDLDVAERDIVLKALTRTGWNVTQAAKLLGLSRDTLRYRIEKHRLKPDA
jgi:two-component system, NtrC family, response regulator AtoC